MKKLGYIITVALVGLAAIVVTVQFSVDSYKITKDTFRSYKMSKRSGDTSKKPTEWFTISRAYPYRDIPFTAYKAALEVFEAAQASYYVEVAKANLRRAEALLEERRKDRN